VTFASPEVKIAIPPVRTFVHGCPLLPPVQHPVDVHSPADSRPGSAFSEDAPLVLPLSC